MIHLDRGVFPVDPFGDTTLKTPAWTQIIPSTEGYGGYGGISVDKHNPGIFMVATTLIVTG